MRPLGPGWTPGEAGKTPRRFLSDGSADHTLNGGNNLVVGGKRVRNRERGIIAVLFFESGDVLGVLGIRLSAELRRVRYGRRRAVYEDCDL